jgi:hypothetical protein
MWRSNSARVAGIAVLALVAALVLLLATPRGQQIATPSPGASPAPSTAAPSGSAAIPTPVPTPVGTQSVDLQVQLPFAWSTMTLPVLPPPWSYGAKQDGDGDSEGYVEIRRDGMVVGAVEMRVFLPANWGDPANGLTILRAQVKNDSGWAEPNLVPDPIREIPFANGTAVRFGYRAPDASGIPGQALIDIWHYDGRAVFRLFTSWPPDPELGNPSFLRGSDFDDFAPVLDELVAHIGLPAVLATPVPVPTPYVDPNMPLPVTWDELTLPKLAAPWELGVDDTSAKGMMTITVRLQGSAVGFVRMLTHLAGAYPSINFQTGGLAALRQLAADDLQGWVDDRAAGGLGLRADPEALREVPVAGGRGFRIAFRDVQIATGKVVGRHVFVYHWDGRALWIFQTDWPPDPEFGRSGFDKLADQQAFDPQFGVLVSGLRLPMTLPSPEPVYP